MAILSDRDIVESMMTGYIGISDYHERGLTPNGYDLRIAEIQVRGDPEVKKEGTVTIPPRTMFYVSTIERVRFPSDICAQLWLRTTWIRKGIIGAFGKIDAGFEGTLTLGAYNATDDPVEIPIGERFCQMVFESLNSESMQDYAKRSGNYQGQTGITLTPNKRRKSPHRFTLRGPRWRVGRLYSSGSIVSCRFRTCGPEQTDTGPVRAAAPGTWQADDKMFVHTLSRRPQGGIRLTITIGRLTIVLEWS